MTTFGALALLLCLSNVGHALNAGHTSAKMASQTMESAMMESTKTMSEARAKKMKAVMAIMKSSHTMKSGMTLKAARAKAMKSEMALQSTTSMKEAMNLTSNMKTSPATRVVKLLEYLMEEIKKEGEYEEDLYEEFICWAKSLIKNNTESINTNIRIIKTLQVETQELQSADVLITDEKERNMKEIARLRVGIMEMTHDREKAHAEFVSANEQMRQAIVALTEATDVLQVAYDKHKDGEAAFLAVKEDVSEYAKESESLSLAVKLAKRFLDDGDASFVQKVLTAQVPVAVPKHNWNKLNKKADFAKSYKARSARILETFAKIKAKIIENKAAAIATEDAAAAEFTELNAAKRDELRNCQQALVDSKVELATKIKRIKKCTIQITVFNEEMDIDMAAIMQADADMKRKKTEWVERKRVREKELKAIAETIEIMHNDDARDALTTSFKSQGYEKEADLTSFLQVRASSTRSLRMGKAAAELAYAAEKSHNEKLAKLAASLKSLAAAGQPETGRARRANPTDEISVIQTIDHILDDLKLEAKEDLAKKEACEKDRELNAGLAVATARQIDDRSDRITALQSQIDEYKAEAARQSAMASAVAAEQTQAADLRLQTNRAYEKDKADDQVAVEIIEKASLNLKKFYDDHYGDISGSVEAARANPVDNPPTSLIQKSKNLGKYNPPQTWTDGQPIYRGRGEEAGTIFFMLEEIVKDIQRDLDLHQKAEDKSRTEYEEWYAASVVLYDKYLAAEGVANQGAVDTEEQRVDEVNLREDDLAVMNQKVETMNELLPGCSYYTVNFAMRVQNRHIEEDGLNKAKTFLLGGVFEDKARPLIVGDN